MPALPKNPPSAFAGSPVSLGADPPTDGRELLPPPWVRRLLDAGQILLPGPDPAAGEALLELTHGRRFCHAALRVPEARALGGAALQAATTHAYRRIEAALRNSHAPHPVRLWNFIPGIHEDPGGGQDRYRAFNAGRHEALSAWLGRDAFDTRVATASGVGHGGQDLIIHCLACDRPGRAVDNPRQIKPYQYSRKFGRLPPCFARATVLAGDAQPLLLVGGTASIVGEESVHVGQLERQVAETLTNLAVLVRAAAEEPAPAEMDAGAREAALACYREVRVYVPDPDRLAALQDLLAAAFPAAMPIEWLPADLCREELLVEIEGVASLPRLRS